MWVRIGDGGSLQLRRGLVPILALFSALSTERTALAQTETILVAPAVESTPEPPARLPLYSLPWQLRPVTNDNVVRVDSAAGVFNDANGNVDASLTTVLSASYQVTKDWASMIRLGFVGNNAPGAALDGRSFANPVMGATYARRIGSYSLSLFGATTIPLGTGGGNTPDLRAAKTNTESITARPADIAMFEVNYLTEMLGADFAYVNHGFTAQAEVTLSQFVRVRGSSSEAATDAFRTNSSVGLHLGYFLGSHFSLGSDLHYRRWLSHPTTVDATGAHVPLSAARMDMFTVAVGPRVHFTLGKHIGIHPGVSVVRGLDARGLDAPLVTYQTTAALIDVPVTF